ncbi:hypothetical protein AV530_012901 [Patagioenas fasciata monilis]|uniref:Strictosidine synthase conserved region domain-containing protein n=1 Tax=Patagioenas fasciata monilis TaxID=372326 RepID=A0A1V4J9B6_PATFA|nr:hypothetical protein AV530_012901 [Patagioenas fasciata monilis]
MPGYLNFAIDLVPFEKPPAALVGPFQVNKNLQSGKRIFTGQLKGPESFTVDDEGNIYTGTVNGKLWMISGDQLHFITQMGQNIPECGTPDYEPVCSRPHGVQMDKDSNLIVVDSYSGLYKVSPRTGEKTLLLPSEKGVDGLPFKFLNGLEVSNKNLIYFVDSSSNLVFHLHVLIKVIETNHLGCLLAYDPVTRRGRTLLSGLYMANGIALSLDEDHILIAETSIYRLIRYWVSGANAGKNVFVDNLPGYPDNIRLSNMGLYRVGISTTRFPGFFFPFLDALGPYPFLKRFITKVTPLSFYSVFLHKHSLFLETNDKGDIVATFQCHLGCQ